MTTPATPATTCKCTKNDAGDCIHTIQARARARQNSPTDVRNDVRPLEETLHDFTPDDNGLSCVACNLPLDNRRHRTESRLRHLINRKIAEISEDVADLQSLNDQLAYVLSNSTSLPKPKP